MKSMSRQYLCTRFRRAVFNAVDQRLLPEIDQGRLCRLVEYAQAETGLIGGRNGPFTSRQLPAILGVARSTASAALSRWEKLGLLIRVPAKRQHKADELRIAIPDGWEAPVGLPGGPVYVGPSDSRRDGCPVVRSSPVHQDGPVVRFEASGGPAMGRSISVDAVDDLVLREHPQLDLDGARSKTRPPETPKHVRKDPRIQAMGQREIEDFLSDKIIYVPFPATVPPSNIDGVSDGLAVDSRVRHRLVTQATGTIERIFESAGRTFAFVAFDAGDVEQVPLESLELLVDHSNSFSRQTTT